MTTVKIFEEPALMCVVVKLQPTALLHSRCTPPRTCSSLKNHFSAPNHRTDIKKIVYDPNTSKNKKKFFKAFHHFKLAEKV